MKLDRTLQREILERLRDVYPELLPLHAHPDFQKSEFQANLFYLHEHQLLAGNKSLQKGVPPRILFAQITAQGLDFLEDDGGLSAILKTVTVKLDADNIRSLLEDKIIASHLPQEQKESFIRKIKGLSGDMLKSVVLQLVEKAMEHPEQFGTLLARLAL